MKWYEVVGLIVGIVSLMASLIFNFFQWKSSKESSAVSTSQLVSNRESLKAIKDCAAEGMTSNAVEHQRIFATIEGRADGSLTSTNEILTRYFSLGQEKCRWLFQKLFKR